MVGAKLWKRILNEGINGGDQKMLGKIIKSTIIVDERPEISEWLPSLNVDMGRLSFPFSSFWIEGSAAYKDIGVGGRFGSLVEITKTMDGFFVFMLLIRSCILCPQFVCGYGFETDCSGLIRPASRHYAIPREFLIEATEDKIKSTGKGLASLACDTLLMLSCKNVSLTPHDNEPKQVRRAIKRHGGTPESYRYHTLVVRPPGAKSNAPAQEIGIMPRHVCRGHFSEYGPEFGKGLLFGKYAGRFFIPPHLKGDKKNGVVEKDYRIPAPEITASQG